MIVGSQSSTIDNNHCGICLGTMSNYGPNQVVCLKCGHMFCLRCIDTALRFKNECPVCKESAKRSDIRRLFFTNVEIRDELAFHNLEANLAKEKNMRERLEEDLLWKDLEIENLKKLLAEKEKELSSLRESNIDDPGDSVFSDHDSICNKPESPSKESSSLDFDVVSQTIVEAENPRFLIFAECDFFGNHLPQSSSFFYSSSNDLFMYDLSQEEVHSVCSFPSSPSTLTSFPNLASPLLLTSYSNTLCLMDVRAKCISGMTSLPSSPISCCCSQKQYQFFVNSQDGIREYDLRLLNKPCSYLTSSASLKIFSTSRVSILQITSNAISQYAFTGNGWTRLSRLKSEFDLSQSTVQQQGNEILIGSETEEGLLVYKGDKNELNYELKQEQLIPYSLYPTSTPFSRQYKPCFLSMDEEAAMSVGYGNCIRYYSLMKPQTCLGECNLAEDETPLEESSLYYNNTSLVSTNKGIRMNVFSHHLYVFSKQVIHISLSLLKQKELSIQ